MNRVELDGQTYFFRNGRWFDASWMEVPLVISRQLDARQPQQQSDGPNVSPTTCTAVGERLDLQSDDANAVLELQENFTEWVESFKEIVVNDAALFSNLESLCTSSEVSELLESMKRLQYGREMWKENFYRRIPNYNDECQFVNEEGAFHDAREKLRDLKTPTGAALFGSTQMICLILKRMAAYEQFFIHVIDKILPRLFKGASEMQSSRMEVVEKLEPILSNLHERLTRLEAVDTTVGA